MNDDQVSKLYLQFTEICTSIDTTQLKNEFISRANYIEFLKMNFFYRLVHAYGFEMDMFHQPNLKTFEEFQLYQHAIREIEEKLKAILEATLLSIIKTNEPKFELTDAFAGQVRLSSPNCYEISIPKKYVIGAGIKAGDLAIFHYKDENNILQIRLQHRYDLEMELENFRVLNQYKLIALGTEPVEICGKRYNYVIYWLDQNFSEYRLSVEDFLMKHYHKLQLTRSGYEFFHPFPYICGCNQKYVYVYDNQITTCPDCKRRYMILKKGTAGSYLMAQSLGRGGGYMVALMDK